MKKALIGIVIAVAGICCVAGGYYYEMVGHSGDNLAYQFRMWEIL